MFFLMALLEALLLLSFGLLGLVTFLRLTCWLEFELLRLFLLIFLSMLGL